MRGIWKSAWIMLRRRKLSSALTIAGIAVGTALVVVITGISNVGERTVQQEMESMGINGISVSATAGLTKECLTQIRTMPLISQAMPLIIQYGYVDVQSEQYSVVGCGIDGGADQVISLSLVHGRMLTAEDVQAESEVCVLDETLALDAYGRSNVLGEKITVMLEGAQLDMTVVGVTAADSSLLQSVTSMIPYMVYAPYTTVQSAVGVDTFNQIAVRVTDPEDTEKVRLSINESLGAMGEDFGTLMTENLAAQRQHLDSLVSVIATALAAIGCVSLLVSAFGIMTMMLSSVNERTREIGIKKAIGATKPRIMSEFLAGALLMSGLGALLGMLVGVVGLSACCYILGITPVWSAGQLLGVLALTLVLGAVFGAYPAYNASGLRPVDALRRDG